VERVEAEVHETGLGVQVNPLESATGVPLIRCLELLLRLLGLRVFGHGCGRRQSSCLDGGALTARSAVGATRCAVRTARRITRRPVGAAAPVLRGGRLPVLPRRRLPVLREGGGREPDDQRTDWETRTNCAPGERHDGRAYHDATTA